MRAPPHRAHYHRHGGRRRLCGPAPDCRRWLVVLAALLLVDLVQAAASEGGQQWVFSTVDRQSCDDACAALSGGSPRPCIGERFREVVSETYFVENVQGGADCGAVYGLVPESDCPYSDIPQSQCWWGDHGDCSSTTSSGSRRFCPCACPSGAYSDTGDASACKP